MSFAVSPATTHPPHGHSGTTVVLATNYLQLVAAALLVCLRPRPVYMSHPSRAIADVTNLLYGDLALPTLDLSRLLGGGLQMYSVHITPVAQLYNLTAGVPRSAAEVVAGGAGRTMMVYSFNDTGWGEDLEAAGVALGSTDAVPDSQTWLMEHASVSGPIARCAMWADFGIVCGYVVPGVCSRWKAQVVADLAKHQHFACVIHPADCIECVEYRSHLSVAEHINHLILALVFALDLAL